MAQQDLTVRPIAGALGAEIGGIDLSHPLVPAARAALRQALLDHLVLVARGQALSPGDLLALARSLGTPQRYPFVRGLDGHPQIVPVIKEADQTHNFGGLWHSDTTYLPRPPMATILYGVELPDCGGDTEFANQYLAWESLSDGMKALLDGLVAVNSSAKPGAAATRRDAIRRAPGAEAGAERRAAHPAVRTHPETGRKALYVNTAHTIAFEGMSAAESAPLLDYLFRHQIRADFTCRIRWRPGTLAIWDNRAAQHNAINDYHGQRRVMHRITLEGDRPA